MKKIKVQILISLQILLFTSIISSQSTSTKNITEVPQVVSISPTFNEIANNSNPEIRVSFNVSMDFSSFDRVSFAVFGGRSGYHTGEIKYFNESKIVTFNSSKQFSAGERVNVSLSRKIISQQGDTLNGFYWQFRIPSKPVEINFSKPVKVEYGGGGMQIIDMNNDGSPDIVTSSGVILLNSGKGDFPTNWFLPEAGYPIVVDDINHDGKMDVVYGRGTILNIGIGNGDGNFILQAKPWRFTDFITADFNNDGYPDIAGIGTYDSTSYLAIALNDGRGNFNDTVWAGQLSGWFQKIASADIDNDGDVDILIISHNLTTPTIVYGLDGLAVFRNNGEGIFNQVELYPSVDYNGISSPSHLYTSDFNNDSFIDVAVLGYGGMILLNFGDGTFHNDSSSTRPFWQPEQGGSLTGGDVNGDSWIDIAVSGYQFLPEMPITYYAVITNCNSHFVNDCSVGYNDTLPTSSVYTVAMVDIDGDNDLDLIHNSDAGLYITFNKDTVTSIDDNFNIPKDFHLYQNFPNPFNSSTTISFEVNKSETILITIYNILGQEVRLLEKKEFLPGKHKVVWDGRDNNGWDLPSGAYFFRVNSSISSQLIKTMLLK